MSGLDDILDDVAPPPLCPACERPLNVEPLTDESLLLALVCPAHGVVGTLDAHDEL